MPKQPLRKVVPKQPLRKVVPNLNNVYSIYLSKDLAPLFYTFSHFITCENAHFIYKPYQTHIHVY
jgi:hypothetical protein